jgi:hypothetical protein
MGKYTGCSGQRDGKIYWMVQQKSYFFKRFDRGDTVTARVLLS